MKAFVKDRMSNLDVKQELGENAVPPETLQGKRVRVLTRELERA